MSRIIAGCQRPRKSSIHARCVSFCQTTSAAHRCVGSPTPANMPGSVSDLVSVLDLVSVSDPPLSILSNETDRGSSRFAPPPPNRSPHDQGMTIPRTRPPPPPTRGAPAVPRIHAPPPPPREAPGGGGGRNVPPPPPSRNVTSSDGEICHVNTCKCSVVSLSLCLSLPSHLPSSLFHPSLSLLSPPPPPSLTDTFENRFQFSSDLPPPEPWKHGPKTYPSSNYANRGSHGARLGAGMAASTTRPDPGGPGTNFGQPPFRS